MSSLAVTSVIPPAPRPWDAPRPLWRTLLQLRRNALPTWGPPAYEHELLLGRFLGRQSVLVNDPGAIRRVLVDNHEAYGRTPATLRILHPMIGDGLFLAEGEAWRAQRRVSAPAFAPRALGIVRDTAVRLTDERLDALARDGQRVVNMLSLVQTLTLDVAGQALFSQAMAPHAAELRRYLDRYGRWLARPSPLDFAAPAWLPTPLGVARELFGRSWKRLIERLIAERRAQSRDGSGRDLFELLDSARDPETGKGFTPEELRDQFATLIIAGHETTALTLFWSAYLLALAPDWQEAIAAEAGEGTIARAVIQEALRLYPPAFTIVREARKADRLGQYEIEPGALIVVSPWVLHRHLRRWTEPARFDPRRFLPGAPPPDRFAYLPFGVGPRVCIGAQFALVEAAAVLERLLRRHRLELVRRQPVQPVGVVTIYPDRAPLFRLRPR
jgi:cytochrome P450